MDYYKIKSQIISIGVKTLNERGFSLVTEENILTDFIYSEFFLIHLNKIKGKLIEVDIVIDNIINSIMYHRKNN